MEKEKLLFTLNLQNFAEDDESNEDDENLDDEDVDDIDDTTDETDNQENKKDDQQKKQSREKNAIEAKKRREREEEERKLKEKQIRDKAFIEGQLSASKTNTFTEQPIKDEYDLKIFNLQKQLQSEGKDPIKDLPSKLAEMERNEKTKAAEELKKKKEEDDRIDNDIKDFKEKNPDVDIKKLLKDSLFEEYSDGKIGNKSLNQIYEGYKKFKDKYKLADTLDKEKNDKEKSKNQGKYINPNGGSGKSKSSYSSLTKEEKIKLLKSEGLI